MVYIFLCVQICTYMQRPGVFTLVFETKSFTTWVVWESTGAPHMPVLCARAADVTVLLCIPVDAKVPVRALFSAPHTLPLSCFPSLQSRRFEQEIAAKKYKKTKPKLSCFSLSPTPYFVLSLSAFVVLYYI